MTTNDFLIFGGAGGANVINQATYAGLSARSSGFVNGIALPEQANKVWRQASLMSNMLGRFITTYGLADALDSGTSDDLLTGFLAGLAKNSATISLTNPGYVIWNNGLVEMWGNQSIATGNGDIVNLPTSFPTAILGVIASDTGNGCNSCGWTRNGASLSTFKAYGMNSAGSFVSTAYGWRAFGN